MMIQTHILTANMLYQSLASLAFVMFLCGSQVIAGDEAGNDRIQAMCRDSAERGASRYRTADKPAASIRFAV